MIQVGKNIQSLAIKILVKSKYTPQKIQLNQTNKNEKYINSLIKVLKYSINQSKYYKPTVPVEVFLKQSGIQFNDNSARVFRIKYCPFCKKPHNHDPTNLYTLNVDKQNGLYYCHRCAIKGSYLDLKKALLGINVDPIISDFTEPSVNIRQIQQQSALSQAQYFIYKQNMARQQYKDVIAYLNSRGLTNQTIQKYNIGSGYETFYDIQGSSIDVKVMYFPMYKLLTSQEQKKKLMKSAISSQQLNFEKSYDLQLCKVKIRGVGKQNKKYMRQMPTGISKGIFGLQTIKKSDTIVVITQGELDAMSVYQNTGLPAVSLPQGANSLPDTILSYFDQFQKIILWMDNDEAGKMNVQKFALKLGVSRTAIVVNNQKQFKDANDFLMKKPEKIRMLINKARTIPDQNILTFDVLRQQIKQRLTNEKKFQGVQLQTFNFFNKKVKGIRNSELSVVSGATGSGKTTFLSQISLELCKKKIPVLWGSFEIRNQVLISNMLTQYSDVNLKKHKNSFDHFADQFMELPLYYMSFHGTNDINKVLGTITYSIEKYGVSFIVIDTLQFLLSGQAEGYKKFDFQDYVMSQLRKIATNYNVHIAVVIHPRKTQDNQDIGIHSIYGTSKATQQADNIWVIQNREGFKVFQIKKNRYDGDVGRVALGFNKNNKLFFELRKKQLEVLFHQSKSIQQILDDRQKQRQQKETGSTQSWFNLSEQDLTGEQTEFNRANKWRRNN